MKIVPGAPYTEPPYCNKTGQDEIARLRVDNARLRGALGEFFAYVDARWSAEPETELAALFDKVKDALARPI